MGKARTSVIWKYFTPVSSILAICNICRARISYRTSTSSMKKHIDNKHTSIELPGLVLGQKRREQLAQLETEKSIINLSDLVENGVQFEVLQEVDVTEIDSVSEVLNENVATEPESQQENSCKEQDLEARSHSQKSNESDVSKLDRLMNYNKKKIFNEFRHLSDHQYQTKLMNSSTPTSVVKENSNQCKEDMYDYFGKYIASLLRDIGNPMGLTLQEEIASVMVRQLCIEYSKFKT